MRKKMHTPLPPSPDHDLHHVADDIFRRMEYSPGPINTDDAKEKHDHHHEQKKAFAQLLSGYFQKLAMGVPPPLPAAARALGGAAKQVAKPGTAAILAGAGTGFKKAPALNPFKTVTAAVKEAVSEKWVRDTVSRNLHPVRANATRVADFVRSAGKNLGKTNEKFRQSVDTWAANPSQSTLGKLDAQSVHHKKRMAALSAGEAELTKRGSAITLKKQSSVLTSFFDELLEKIGADLTPEARAKLPTKDFAVKAKKSNTGREAYPMPDAAHARAALGFSKMHGDDADIAAVRKKVEQRFPGMLHGK